MRWIFANRPTVSNDTPLDTNRAGQNRPGFNLTDRKLAFAMLLVFLLTLTIFEEWKRTASPGSRSWARREAIPQTLDALGEQCIVDGAYIEAIFVFETLLEAYPDYALAEEALLRVGLCWLRLDNEPMAVEAWERLLKLYPTGKHAQKVRQGWLIIMKHRPHGIPV